MHDMLNTLALKNKSSRASKPEGGTVNLNLRAARYVFNAGLVLLFLFPFRLS